MNTVPTAQSKQDGLAAWRSRGRMVVPSKAGKFIDLIIVHIFETTALNGLPLDLLISARKTQNEQLHQFGVLFSDNSSTSTYPIPVLWYTTSGQLQGWLKTSHATTEREEKAGERI